MQHVSPRSILAEAIRPAHGPAAASPRWLYCRQVKQKVEDVVERACGVSAERLNLPVRGCGRVLRARQIAFYLARTEAGMTFAEVGDMFERTRQVAAHATASIEDRRDFEPGLDDLLDRLAADLRAVLDRLAATDDDIVVMRAHR